LGKNDPLWEDFENFVPKGFTISHNHVLCANFVKFGRPEIGKVVRYLPDKKKRKIGPRSRSRFCADRAQNLPGPAPDNILRVPQISSKSVTSGGVIAERVNVVQTRHKVFPIFGEASASPSKNCSLYTLLTARIKNRKNHTKALLTTLTLIFRRC